MRKPSRNKDKKIGKLFFVFFIAFVVSLYSILICWIGPRLSIAGFESILEPAKIHNIKGKPGEMILARDPFKSPSFVLIENPDLELGKYAVNSNSIIPPLYKNLTSIPSSTVRTYLEKRNQYVQKFTDTYLYMDEKNQEALKPPFDSCNRIEEILPFTYKNQEGVFIVSEEMALLNTDMEVLEVKRGSCYQMGVTASAKFTDRFWHLYAHAGATGGYVYYDVVNQNYFSDTTTFKLGGNYDSDIDPFSVMKIINVRTNPTMDYYWKSPNRDSFSIYSFGYVPSGIPERLLNVTFLSSLCIFLASLGAMFILLLVMLFAAFFKGVGVAMEKRRR